MTTLGFEDVLTCLRGVAWPCAPPIGVGEFEVLYVSAVEVVVWYTPAREGHRTGEVAIPCARLAAAWQRLRAGAALDEAGLSAVCGGAGWGRWALALLALVPGACVRQEPLTLAWAPDSAAEAAGDTASTASTAGGMEDGSATGEAISEAVPERRTRRGRARP